MSEGEKTETLSLRREINWLKVLFHIQLLLSLLCGFHYLVYEAQWKTALFTLLLIPCGILGTTAGCHRLWAHQSYKATTGLRIFLMLCSCLVGNGPIYDWVQWHRLHHKHYSTDLDPFNPKKGFLYAHFVGCTRSLSPAQEQALKDIDMSDIENDKIVMFQKRYYYPLFFLVGFLLPVNAPAEYWGETIVTSVFVTGWFRYAIVLHAAYLIHSATRIWGLQPGEKFPCDTNWVFILTKTFWLSYHYLAPWDYQTGEYGDYGTNCTSKFIRVCAALELASDLKTVDSNLARSALVKSVNEEKPVEECLKELSNSSKLPAEHYLSPTKYYASG